MIDSRLFWALLLGVATLPALGRPPAGGADISKSMGVKSRRLGYLWRSAYKLDLHKHWEEATRQSTWEPGSRPDAMPSCDLSSCAFTVVNGHVYPVI